MRTNTSRTERSTTKIGRIARLAAGYAACGGTAAVVDFSLLYALTELAGVWYWTSACMAYLAGMIVNYTLNKYVNFKNRSRRIVPQFTVFAAVAAAGLLLNQSILLVLVEWGNIWYMSAKVVAAAVVLCWSFYGHYRFTFRMFG